MGRKQRINVEDFKNTQELATYKFLKSRQTKYRYRIEYENETIPYVIEKSYIPDFKLTLSNGQVIYIEYKGYLRKDDERKMLNVIRQHPDKDIRIVFQKDNRMTGRKLRYSDWCKKHGLEYAIGTVPEEWFELDQSKRKTRDIRGRKPRGGIRAAPVGGPRRSKRGNHLRNSKETR